MIARTWTGRTKKEHAQSYTKVLLDTGIAGMKKTPGNRGAWILRRIDGDEAEFTLISFWESLETIKAFAGDEVDKARYFPEDDPFLLSKPDKVIHFEVVHSHQC